MRLLLDNNLSVRLPAVLAEAGFDALHVHSFDLAAADDRTVLGKAAEEDRVLVSADTDFGYLLASTRATAPSVVLIRRGNERRHLELARLLEEQLPLVADDLAAGAVVVLGRTELRVRRLPIR